jgi:hypothetical protein
MLSLAITSVVVIMGEVEIHLLTYLITSTIIFVLAIGIFYSLIFIGFYRVNTDLSPRYKHRMFMPFLVMMIVFGLTTICMGVYCSRDSCDFDKDDPSKTSALMFCFGLYIIGAALLAREIGPAVYSAQYPEGADPGEFLLLSSRATEIRQMRDRYAAKYENQYPKMDSVRVMNE